MASHQGLHPMGNIAQIIRAGAGQRQGLAWPHFSPTVTPHGGGCGSCFLGFAGNRMKGSEKLTDSSEVTQLASGCQIHSSVS